MTPRPESTKPPRREILLFSASVVFVALLNGSVARAGDAKDAVPSFGRFLLVERAAGAPAALEAARPRGISAADLPGIDTPEEGAHLRLAGTAADDVLAAEEQDLDSDNDGPQKKSRLPVPERRWKELARRTAWRTPAARNIVLPLMALTHSLLLSRPPPP